MGENAPKEGDQKPTIEVFTDDELKQLKDANKRHKAEELQKLLKRIKALDAMDAAYDEKAAALRVNMQKQLGKYGITTVKKSNISDDDDSSNN